MRDELNQLLALNRNLNEELHALKKSGLDSNPNANGLLHRSTAANTRPFLEEDAPEDSLQGGIPPSHPFVQELRSDANISIPRTPAKSFSDHVEPTATVTAASGPLTATPTYRQAMARLSAETPAADPTRESASPTPATTDVDSLSTMSSFFARLQT